MRLRSVPAFLGLACALLAWPTAGADPATPPPRIGLPFDAERARSLQAEWARTFGLDPELTNSAPFLEFVREVKTRFQTL